MKKSHLAMNFMVHSNLASLQASAVKHFCATTILFCLVTGDHLKLKTGQSESNSKTGRSSS